MIMKGKNAFFRPFVGENYEHGINGQKVLVLGASFYCNHAADCLFYKECTSLDKKDSSAFNSRCPYLREKGHLLEDEPRYCVCDSNKTYRNFASLLSCFTGFEKYMDNWDCVAFTNYVQYFLDGHPGQYRATYKRDLSERDSKAFIEVCEDLKPNIVVAWGTVINSQVRELAILDNLVEQNWWMWSMRLPSRHILTVVNPYHPSSSKWWSSRKEFCKWMNVALDQVGRHKVFEVGPVPTISTILVKRPCKNRK